MFAFIPILLQWVAPAVMTFMTPDKCLAIFKAISATIEFVAKNHADESPDEQYKKATIFLIAQYDLLDSVAGIHEEIDTFVKETVFPIILTFVYGSHE